MQVLAPALRKGALDQKRQCLVLSAHKRGNPYAPFGSDGGLEGAVGAPQIGGVRFRHYLQNRVTGRYLDDPGKMPGFDSAQRISQFGTQRIGIDFSEETAIG